MDLQLKNSNNGFIGYYFKHASSDALLSIIVGSSNDEDFIQIITEDSALKIPYKEDDIRVKQGLLIDIEHDNTSIHGYIYYNRFTPLKHHIMGPFKYTPLCCQHNIISMKHKVHGSLNYNGKLYDFHNGTGYIEMDSGTSFPKEYIWIQGNEFKSGTNLFLAIAKLDLFKVPFMGCICAVQLKYKEYIFATYKGCKVLKYSKNEIIIKQGSYKLCIYPKEIIGYELSAPEDGKMNRTIREQLNSSVQFEFYKNNKVILIDEGRASIEYEMNA